jgi:hypothetical protein
MSNAAEACCSIIIWLLLFMEKKLARRIKPHVAVVRIITHLFNLHCYSSLLSYMVP